MRILIAPDKFKSCLSAAQAARAMADGLRRADPAVELDLCPVADGGEGTVDALVQATGGQLLVDRVTGPLPGTRVSATWGILGDGQTGVIEMAAASGLHLLPPEQRDPLRTTSFGTGELISIALSRGLRRVIVGIGGSATVDGGIGCLQAMGAMIELKDGEIARRDGRRLTGADLPRILSIAMPAVQPGINPPAAATQPAFGQVPIAPPRDSQAALGPVGNAIEPTIVVACDVANPLYGPNGAAAIFGPQKGAGPVQVEFLDRALWALAQRTGLDAVAQSAGAGAAGGLGFALRGYCGAVLRSGVEIVTEAVHLRRRLQTADLCLTGEGRLDAQSLAGKTAIGVARLCRAADVPCIALTGDIGPGALQALGEGLTACFSICQGPCSREESMTQAPRLLADLACNILRAWSSGRT